MPAEEARFFNGENHLLLSSHYCVDVDLMIRKYSFSGFINENQWENICLYLDIPPYTNPSIHTETIKMYYDLYKTDKGYRLDWLLVLALFLSGGSDEVKAKLLFEIFDNENVKILTKETIEKMSDVIFDILVEKNKALVRNDDPNRVSEEEHLTYLERLRSGYKTYKIEFVSKMINQNQGCSLKEFVEKHKSDEPQLNTIAYRKALKEYGSKYNVSNGRVYKKINIDST